MSELLRDYEFKRRRAMFHLDRLRESIEDAPNRRTEAIRGEPNPNRSQHRFQVPMPKVNPDWLVMIGDFCFNRRASLDYLVTALVRSTGQTEDETNQFPIYCPRLDNWRKIESLWDNDPRGTLTRYLNNTPSLTKAALKPLQPFHGVPMTNPWHHPLYTLQILNNRDKHRRLNLLARRASVDFRDAQGKPVFDAPAPDVRVASADEHGTYAVILNGQLDMDVYLLAAHDIRFDERQGTWPLMDEVIETLERINEFIDTRVVPVVKRLMR